MRQPILVWWILMAGGFLAGASLGAAAALPPPYGTNPPTLSAVSAADAATLGASITEAYQFGPGIWSTPGLSSLSGSFLSGKFGAANPMTPAYPVGNPPSPLLGALTAENYFLGINAPAPAAPSPFGVAVGIFGANYNKTASLSALYNPATPTALTFAGAQFTSPSAAVPIGNLIQMGFFSSTPTMTDASSATATDTAAWAKDYLALYKTLSTAPHNMSLAKQSRGAYLISQLQDVPSLSPTLADQDIFYRQILARHNQQLASYRAIGLNPMWPNGSTNIAVLNWPFPAPAAIPPVGTSPFPIPGVAQIPDNLLNLQAKYFYQQSFKHTASGNNYQVDEMGLLYQIFAATLAYESGWVNTRYVPLDPSCRYLTGTPPACTVALSAASAGFAQTYFSGWSTFQAKQYDISFGSAGDFVNVYNVLKYCASAWGQGLSFAQGILLSNMAPLKSAVQLRLGVPYPTDLDGVLIVAHTLFDRAMTIWSKLSKEGSPGVSQSVLLAPRVSAAFIAAAALVGKKVDPVFWGALAEAEQIIMKNQPASYWKSPAASGSPSWSEGLFTNATIINDFGLSLTDFGVARPVAATPSDYVATLSTVGAIGGLPGLKNILLSARDSITGNFALARGPSGLMSLTSDGVGTSEEYITSASAAAGTPYPNAFLEAAATGRAIIDGRLRVNSDGSIVVFDVNDAPLSSTKYLLPFEAEVLNGYANAATQLWNAPYSSLVAPLAANTRKQPGAAQNQELGISLTYGALKGNYQPVGINPNDSRFFQPANEFWLVVEEKMGNVGIPPAPGATPPKISSVTYAPKPRANYTLMNLITVNLTTGVVPPAQYNYITLDVNKPKFIKNTWYQDTLNLWNMSVAYPFFSTTNSYIYFDTSAVTALPLPTVTLSAGGLASAAPAVAASGPASVPCKMILSLMAHDPQVKCPNP